MFPGKTCCCCSIGGSLPAKPWILLGLGLLVLLVAGACATGPTPDGRPEGLPSWVPLYPDGTVTSHVLEPREDGADGTVTITVTGELRQVTRQYLSMLKDANFGTELMPFPAGGVDGAMITARNADDSRGLNVSIVAGDDGPEMIINYSETEGGSPSTASVAYTVRGELVSLPDADDAMSFLRIQHEAIPEMVGHDGEVSGMDSMTMPFSTREGLSVEGFSVGDKVEFDLDVDWDRTPALLVTGIRPLAADTALSLEHDHGG